MDHDQCIVFADEDIRQQASEVIDLEGGGLLAVDTGQESWLSFVVLEFFSGPATMDGVVVEGIRYQRVFHGSGSAGLRELRHTYWGNGDGGGYIFYPSGKLITDAFKHLLKWFDCD